MLVAAGRIQRFRARARTSIVSSPYQHCGMRVRPAAPRLAHAKRGPWCPARRLSGLPGCARQLSQPRRLYPGFAVLETCFCNGRLVYKVAKIFQEHCTPRRAPERAGAALATLLYDGCVSRSITVRHERHRQTIPARADAARPEKAARLDACGGQSADRILHSHALEGGERPPVA